MMSGGHPPDLFAIRQIAGKNMPCVATPDLLAIRLQAGIQGNPSRTQTSGLLEKCVDVIRFIAYNWLIRAYPPYK